MFWAYSECKIAKIFRGFVPVPHWGGLTPTPPPFLRLPSCTTVFLLATLIGKLTPPKNCWIRHWLYPLLSSLASIISLTELNKSYSYWITLKNWFLSFWIIFKLYFHKKTPPSPSHTLTERRVYKQAVTRYHEFTPVYQKLWSYIWLQSYGSGKHKQKNCLV